MPSSPMTKTIALKCRAPKNKTPINHSPIATPPKSIKTKDAPSSKPLARLLPWHASNSVAMATICANGNATRANSSTSSKMPATISMARSLSRPPNSSINADKLLPKRATSSSIRLSLAPNAHSAFQTHLCGTTISTSISSAFIAITTPSSPRNSAISLRKASPIQKSSRNYATMLVSKIRAIASNLLLAPMALKNSNQLSAHSIPPSETIHSHNPYYLRPPLRADYVQTAARHACRPCQKRRPPRVQAMSKTPPAPACGSCQPNGLLVNCSRFS